jgi:hypothetical protein
MSRNVGWMSDQSGMAVSKFFVFGLNISLLLGIYLNSNIGSYFISLFSSIKGVFGQTFFHPQFCFSTQQKHTNLFAFLLLIGMAKMKENSVILSSGIQKFSLV